MHSEVPLAAFRLSKSHPPAQEMLFASCGCLSIAVQSDVCAEICLTSSEGCLHIHCRRRKVSLCTPLKHIQAGFCDITTSKQGNFAC